MHYTRCGQLNSSPSDAVVEFDVRTKVPREAARSAYSEKHALPRYGFGSSRSLQRQPQTPLAIEKVWCFHEWTNTYFAEAWSLHAGRSEHKIIDNIPFLDRLHIPMHCYVIQTRRTRTSIKHLSVQDETLLSVGSYQKNSHRIHSGNRLKKNLQQASVSGKANS